MTVLLRSFVIVIIAILLANTQARAYYYKQYTISNGLLSNTVYHAYRDSKGYIWFFTDKGVTRFDGADFKNFTVFDGIPDEEAYTGYEDRFGRLWIFTASGNPCFIKNDTVFNAGNNELLKKLPTISYMIAVHETADSSIYIAYNDGQIIKIKGNNYTYIVSKPIKQIFSLAPKGDTIIAYGSQCTYYLYHDQVVRYKTTPFNNNYHDSHELISAGIGGISIYKNDSLVWHYSGGKNRGNNKGIDTSIGYLSSLDVFYDGNETLFSCTKNGLTTINTRTYKEDVIFEHMAVSSAIQDIYGNFWVTTLTHGVYCINKDLDKIKALPQVTDHQLYTLNNGQIFFSKPGSLYHLACDDTVKLGRVPISLSAIQYPLYIDDNYFFYKNHHNLFYKNLHTQAIDTVLEFRYLYPMDKNKLLSISISSIGVLTTSRNKITLDFLQKDSKFISHKNIYDKNGKIYFDKANQIYYYDIQTRTTKLIDSLNYYQSIHNIFYIDNQLIVITNDQKIILYDAKNNYVKYAISGYPFICYDISSLETSPGKIKYLLNTDRGYYITDNIKDIKTSYRKLEYPSKSKDLFAVATSGHYMICNVNNAYYIIDDSLIEKGNQKPVFYITAAEVNGRKLTSNTKTINYKSQNDASITLNCLKFNNINNTYQYRVARDKDTSTWYSSASDKLEILLDKYGHYSIEIRAVTDNNTLSESRFVTFTITPPFYRTITFSVIVGLSLALAIYIGIVLYNRRKKKIFENELDYLQLEHKAINSLLNPHFIFNAINNIQNLININSKETANNYLAILSKLIRQNIENLQFSFIPVSKELTLVRNYIHLQNLRFGDRINLLINETSAGIENVNIPPLLIHTFVENCVVHGFKKATGAFQITIDLSLSTDDYLIITITDNGIGLTDKKVNTLMPDKLSLGIDFIRKRLSRISAFYHVDFSLGIHNVNKPGETGTEVVIVIYSKFRNEQTVK